MSYQINQEAKERLYEEAFCLVQREHPNLTEPEQEELAAEIALENFAAEDYYESIPTAAERNPGLANY